MSLSNWIFISGFLQLSLLVASALVPMQLEWRKQLKMLPRLTRQLFWVYGGYIVLGIVSLGTISIVCHDELASGSLLARAVCCYGLAFWGIRLALQGVFDVQPHLTTWWLRVGYYLLSVLFVVFVSVYGYAAFA